MYLRLLYNLVIKLQQITRTCTNLKEKKEQSDKRTARWPSNVKYQRTASLVIEAAVKFRIGSTPYNQNMLSALNFHSLSLINSSCVLYIKQ